MGTFNKKQEQQQNQQENEQKLMLQEIAAFQNSGIYRQRLLVELMQIRGAILEQNQAIKQILTDFGTEILALHGKQPTEEEPQVEETEDEEEGDAATNEDDEFSLPPLKLKK